MSGMFKFRKAERLASKKLIQSLFQKSAGFYINPFKVVYTLTELPSDTPAQVMITVSRKSFRKASSRNYVRRLVREAYRLNKQHLYDVLNKNEAQCAIAIIYTGKTIPEFKTVRQKIIEIIDRLIHEISLDPRLQKNK